MVEQHLQQHERVKEWLCLLGWLGWLGSGWLAGDWLGFGWVLADSWLGSGRDLADGWLAGGMASLACQIEFTGLALRHGRA